jgi:type II secretory pathway pseudopilin PulG
MSNKAHSKQQSRRRLSQPRRISARLRSRHSALTLVELLVTIGLITVVSSMFLVAYRAAATEASNIRTQGTIRKISEVLMARMQEYENYPINFETPIPSAANFTDLPDTPTILRDRMRLLALRETMVLEMPDHPDDIKWTTEWMPILGRLGLLIDDNPDPTVDEFIPSPKLRTSGLKTSNIPGQGVVPPTKIKYPSRAKRILQKLDDPTQVGMQPRAGWELRNANAEMLYLIIEDSTINGSSAIELFGKSEIGDTDDDGLLEFLDAFRRPVKWIRWPSGYASSKRLHPDLLDPALYDLINNDPNRRRYRAFGDSFDNIRSDPGYSKLFSTNEMFPDTEPLPLVASAGADGLFGIRFELSPTLPSRIPNAPHDNFIPKPEIASPRQYVNTYKLAVYDTRVSRSTGDVLLASGQPFADPWFPRPRMGVIPENRLSEFDNNDIDLTNDFPDTYRLGALMKDVPFGKTIFQRVAEDDITNYEINGATQ